MFLSTISATGHPAVRSSTAASSRRDSARSKNRAISGLEVLDPAQNGRFRDAFVELPFDLAEVLFLTTANEPARIPPALRDRLEMVRLPGYREAEKIVIAQTHLIGAQNRAAGLTAAPVRFTRGACRRIIREYTSERGIRQLTRCVQAICRKVALGLETGDASLVRDRITAAQVRVFLGAPSIDHQHGLDRLGEQLDAPALPAAVRERGREVVARLGGMLSTDPEHARGREYLRCLASLPWTKRTVAPPALARAKAILDAGHAGHGAVKQRLLDYIAVRLAKPDAPAPVLCLVGPAGVGKTSLAGLVAAALGRACAWVLCAELGGAAALYGARPGESSRSCAASASAIPCSSSTRSTAWTRRPAQRRRCSRPSPRRRGPRFVTAMSICPSICPRPSSWPRPTASLRCLGGFGRA